MSAINVNKNNFNQEVLNSDKPVLIVAGANPKTFQPVPAGGFGGDFNYGKDDKHVFWNDSIIQGADPGSFEKMTFPDGDSWTVFDRNRIYEGKDSPKLREYLKKKYGK